MALTLTPQQGLIFRITHRQNIPWILDNGLHARNGAKFDPNHRNIGHVELIDKRSRRTVPVPPGGTLADYVPFYFTPYSIMMFNIVTGYGGIQKIAKEDIVIFVSSLPRLAERGRQVVFTNQHAFPLTTEYFNDLSALDRIDWLLLQSRNFKHDPEDPGRKERYQAEALIWKQASMDDMLGICCYTKAVEQQLQESIAQKGLTLKAAAQPNWYF